MFARSPWKALLLVGFGLALAGCTNNLVDSIVVSPSTQALTAGQTAQLTATGYQSHGTHPSTNTNVTLQATWTSSAPSVATVSASGLVTAVSAGTTTITASMPGFGGTVTGTAAITVTGTITNAPEPLASLAVDPGAQTALAVNQTVNFIAIGTTSSGATVNLTNQSAAVGATTIKAASWVSSNPQVATINPSTGVATALANGSTTITAQAANPDGTVVIGTATLTVTLLASSSEPLVSIAIVPGTQTLTSLNQPAQFIAIGTTGIGTTVNLTNKVIWSSSSPTVASINAGTGVATALSNGTAAITAVATNPDGTVVTGVASVTVNIAASAEPLVSLAIVPNSQTASVVNQTAQFVAIGTTSSGATVNLTNQPATIGTNTINAAVWGSSSAAVATINQATGLATAQSAGTVAITAQAKNPDGTVVTGTATFTVVTSPEPLISLAIVPATQTLASAGQTAQYIAIGTTASGATVNLTNTKATIGTSTINAATWGSSSGSVATINPVTGVATAVGTGAAVITAVAYNPDGTAVTGTATLNVNIAATSEPLVSLAIVPGTQTASVTGQTAQYIAIGTTSSGATVNLTNQTATVSGATINAAVWGSSSTAIATINPATGLATAVSSGTVAITAQAKNPDGTVVTGTATFTVTLAPEPLVSLTIVPAAETLVSAGQTAQYIAIGTTSTGATVNLTNVKATIGTATINAATWASSNPSVATVSPATGIATAVTSGVAVITAVAYNPDGTAVTGTTTLTVNLSATPEPLVSLAIVPASQTASVVNQTAQFIAIGTTSSGATVNLTNQSATVNGSTIAAAVWGSSSPAVATINAGTGIATAQSTGTVAITAQAKNPDGTVVTGTATFTVNTTPEPLVALSIVPATQTLVTVGETTQYIVIGTTLTGATVNLTNAKATIGNATINAATWTSSTTSVATINSGTGLAVAGTSGVTVITAVAYNPDGTAVTATATLNVNIAALPEPLVSLAIVPATQTASVVGQTAQFIAIGTTSSGATVNLTNESATIGSATINPAVWGSSSNAVATINQATGLATAQSAGTVAISAQAKNPDGTVVTGTATFTVTSTPEPLVSLSIVPGAQTLATAGEPVQFIAIGTTASGATVNLTDVKATIGSATINAATWGSSTMSVATINPVTGLAAAATSGVTVITAVAYNPDGTAVTGTAELTVNLTAIQEPIVSLAIVPATQTASTVNETAQFIAIGTTSSGATVNLTNQSATVGSATISAAVWGSSSNAVATINGATGLATSVHAGTTAITAQVKNPDGTVVTGTATFTVSSTTEPLVSLAIVPASQTLATAGQPVQYIAIGTTSTGATVNLTNVKATIGSATINAATWASSSPTIATINAATGLASAASSGVTVITAVAYNPDGTAVTGTATLTVTLSPTPEPLVSLAIVPASQSVSLVNQTAQFIAIGTTSSGATVDLTNQTATINGATINAAVWGTSSNTIASINPASGIATSHSSGTVAITAQAKNPDGTVVTGTATFTVTSTPEPLVALAIVPAAQTLATAGQPVQYIAIGTTSTGATVNLTNVKAIIGTSTINAATWASSSPTIATINAATGLASAASSGITVITAIAYNPDGTAVTGTATLTVNVSPTPEPLVSLAIVPAAQTASVTGQTAQFIAIGTTLSGATVNLTNQSATVGAVTINPAVWGSSSNAVATINAATGLATAQSAGTVAITAQAKNPDGTVVTGTATFTVASTPEPMVSLAIVPAAQTLSTVGEPVHYIAIGTTVSGATVNLTGVNAQIGSATINAAAWASTSPTVATIDPLSGIALAATSGNTVITATAYNPDGSAVTGTATLTVTISPTPEPLVSLAIVPAAQTASVTGQTAQFIAIGTTSSGATVNLTNQSATIGATTINPAVWGSSSNPVATINPATGLATAQSAGTVAITAQAKNPDGTVVTGTATFTVTSTPEPLVSLTIIPGAQTLASAAETTQYIAIGTTSSGATVNLTNVKATIGAATINAAAWASSTASVATINPATGLAEAAANGVTVITAIAYNPDGTAVTGTATLTVALSAAPEPLVSLAIIPAAQTASVTGQTAQFIAIGTTSTGATVDLTNQSATIGAATINAAVFGSSSNAVATINPATGLATAVSSGAVAITAEAKNPDGTVVTGTATFTVASTPEPLVSLAIVPAAQTLNAIGQTSQYIAIGTTSTGATVNLTNVSATVGSATINPAAWASSNVAVATVNPLTGVATAATSGTTVISAVAYNPDGTAVAATATLTANISATPEPLVSLAIVPVAQTASVTGQTAQFIAIGTTSSGATVNLTNQSATVGAATIAAAVWGSSSAAIATINPATGLATAVSPGTVAITAQAKNPDGTVVTGIATFTITNTPEPLVSLAILPAAQTLTAAGQPAQFIAVGTTSSGATVNLTNVNATIGTATIHAATWYSSTMPVATINAATGLATAGTTGVTAITAIAYNPDGTAVTGTATLTVAIPAAPEPLVSLAIVPAAQQALAINQTAQFIAIGTTSLGTTVNLTNQTATVGSNTIAAATWTSSNPAVATVNPATGVATALSEGTAAIIAIAKNPDGSVVTGTAAYTVTIPSVAEPLVSMAIIPASQTLTLLGQNADLQAIATTGTSTTVNLTNQSATVGSATIAAAVWSSSAPGVATVNVGTGVVTAVNAGTTVITATALNPDNTVVTGVATITVTATGGAGGTIASITVIPGTQGVAAPNDTAQFIAIGTTTTGATVNLTNQVAWSSSSAQIGTIGAATGLATGTGQGTATITALYTPGVGNVVTGTAQFTVTGGSNETYTAITLIPNSLTVAEGQTSQFVALATLGTNGLKVDVTNSLSVKWSSNIPGVGSPEVGGIASVSSSGLVLGLGAGNAVITAELTNPDGTVVSTTAAVTVSQQTLPEPLLSLTIIPAGISVGDLQDTGQFIAIGTFSVVPYVRDLTNAPGTTWLSSFPDSFPVSTNSGGTPSAAAGIVTAYGTGSATIIAEATSTDGTIQTATATFSCPLTLPNPGGDPPTPGTCDVGEVGPLKATLTIYGEGLDTKDWYITAPSATNTPDVIHCGPGWTADGEAGGSVCTAIYPIGTTVTLTAGQAPSLPNPGNPTPLTTTFGGWTYNCTPVTPIVAAGPNSCTIVLGASNATVGAIFN
jgi:uncharacterized protein YjdB